MDRIQLKTHSRSEFIDITQEVQGIVQKKEIKEVHKNEDMQSLFDGKGWAKLFNMNKQISKDGYFWNYKLVIGFDYIYDKEGNLVQIAKFFKGKQIGECPVK